MSNDIHIHATIQLAGLDDMLRLHNSLAHLNNTLEIIMATLDEVLAEVTDETSRLASMNKLISGLEQQLADALAGTTLPTAVQAKVDAVFTALQANKGQIDTALNANTPPAQ